MTRFTGGTGTLLLGLALAPLAAAPVRADDAATVVTVSERAEHSLPRDRMIADLGVEASDADPGRLQGTINKTMAAALARARAVAGITVATTGYSVSEERPDREPGRWHGRQGLRLESENAAALLALVGTLQQDGLVLSDLQPTVSREAARSVEDLLTNEALLRLKDRAERIAATLGMKFMRYRSLHVGNVQIPPPPMRAVMASPMAVSAAPPPVAESGAAAVAVSVDGEIELAPR